MHTTLKVFICAALLVFATGCAGKSTSPSASNLWQQTQQGVLSAYQATKNTVSSIFGKLNFDKSKEKEKITKKTLKLLKDMEETMMATDGVGLSAPGQATGWSADRAPACRRRAENGPRISGAHRPSPARSLLGPVA